MSSQGPQKSSPQQTLPDHPPPAYSNEPMSVWPSPPPYEVAVNPGYYPPSYPQYSSNYPQYTVGYINGQDTVVTTQPVMTLATRIQPPQSHIVYSIFNLLFCCPLIGITALVYSIKTQSSNMSGDIRKATKNSRMALILNNLALSMGIIVITIIVVLCIVIR